MIVPKNLNAHHEDNNEALKTKIIDIVHQAWERQLL